MEEQIRDSIFRALELKVTTEIIVDAYRKQIGHFLGDFSSETITDYIENVREDFKKSSSKRKFDDNYKKALFEKNKYSVGVVSKSISSNSMTDEIGYSDLSLQEQAIYDRIIENDEEHSL